MNKFILHLGLLLGMGSLLCNNERAIRKHLEFLYKNYAINYVQIAENNMSLLDVIDRDIMILEKHMAHLQNKIDKNKRLWAQTISPFAKTITAISCGGVSLFFGLLSFDCVMYNRMPERFPFVSSISLLSAIMSLKAGKSRYKHFSNIEKSIQIWKNKIKRDNAILVYLKELKYQL